MQHLQSFHPAAERSTATGNGHGTRGEGADGSKTCGVQRRLVVPPHSVQIACTCVWLGLLRLWPFVVGSAAEAGGAATFGANVVQLRVVAGIGCGLWLGLWLQGRCHRVGFVVWRTRAAARGSLVAVVFCWGHSCDLVVVVRMTRVAEGARLGRCVASRRAVGPPSDGPPSGAAWGGRASPPSAFFSTPPRGPLPRKDPHHRCINKGWRCIRFGAGAATARRALASRRCLRFPLPKRADRLAKRRQGWR